MFSLSKPAFGTSQPQQAGNTLFGSSQPQQTPSLFGSSQPQQTPSLFGTSQPQQAGSLFGTSQPQQAGSLFGTSQPQQAGSLFGASQPQQAGSLFGTSQPQQAGSLFGTSQPQQAGSLFGTSQPQQQTSLFGQTQPQQQQSQFVGQSDQQIEYVINQEREKILLQQQQQFASLGGVGPGIEQLYRSSSKWDTQSPNCEFLHYFYNVVPENTVGNYYPTAQDSPKLYFQAKKDNNDPTHKVPVLASGFSDIKLRIEQQEKKEEEFRAALSNVKDRVNDIYRKHTLDTKLKLEQYRLRQTKLVHKTLQLLRGVQLIRMHGKSICEEEEILKARLEAMSRELQKPSIFRGRLNEIWTHVQQIKSFKYFAPELHSKSEIHLDDEQQLEKIYQTLQGHQEGLSILKNTLEGYRSELKQQQKRKNDQRSHGAYQRSH